MSGTVALRALASEDRATYNAFLRAGVLAHPTTLRISEDDIDARPFEVAGMEGVTLAAELEGRWLGVGSVERDQGRSKRRHVAWIVRMLVAEPNVGVGRLLLRELIRRSAELPGVEKLNLTVAADNPAAVHLYESEGFVAFSREPDAFRHGTTRVAELTMSRGLR